MAFPFNNNLPGTQSSSSINPDDILDDLIMEEAIRDSQQAAGPKSIYWCHQCEKDIIQPTMPDFLCPLCGGAFIEELPADKQPSRQSAPANAQARPRQQQPNFTPNFGHPMFTQRTMFMPPPAPLMQMFSSMFGAPGGIPQPTPPTPPQHPFAAQQNNPFVYTFVSSSFPASHEPTPAPAHTLGAGVQSNPFFAQPQPGANPHQQILNFSDLIRNIFSGLNNQLAGAGGLDSVINQLFEASMNTRCGPPPAAKSVRDSLPSVQITQSHIDNKDECAICKDEFVLSDVASELPCAHRYHTGCIMPWLESRNSCPVCRHELATDDPDYEARRLQRQQQQQQQAVNPTPMNS